MSRLTYRVHQQQKQRRAHPQLFASKPNRKQRCKPTHHKQASETRHTNKHANQVRRAQSTKRALASKSKTNTRTKNADQRKHANPTNGLPDRNSQTCTLSQHGYDRIHRHVCVSTHTHTRTHTHTHTRTHAHARARAHAYTKTNASDTTCSSSP